MKFSAGRGGLVTSAGVDAASSFVRQDTFDGVDDEFRPQGRAAAAANVAAGTAAPLGRQPSTSSDGFSAGGEDSGGEGFWGRQCDPESGMAYYLNEKVGAEFVLDVLAKQRTGKGSGPEQA